MVEATELRDSVGAMWLPGIERVVVRWDLTFVTVAVVPSEEDVTETPVSVDVSGICDTSLL